MERKLASPAQTTDHIAWKTKLNARSANPSIIRRPLCSVDSTALSKTEQMRKNGLPLADHGADAVRSAITSSMFTLPAQLRRSLTWDQGAEMSQHVRLRVDTGLQIYFREPRSPWQRRTNENTNGFLRQYFRNGTRVGVGVVPVPRTGWRLISSVIGKQRCRLVHRRRGARIAGDDGGQVVTGVRLLHSSDGAVIALELGR